MSTLIVYDEREILPGERVAVDFTHGRGVRGDPYRHLRVVGTVALVWRTRIGRPPRPCPLTGSPGRRMRFVAVDLDDGARLIVGENRVDHLVRKPHPKGHVVWRSDDDDSGGGGAA